MDRLRLRRQGHTPRHLDETETLFADASGNLKQLSAEGDVSDVGGGGGSLTYLRVIYR